MPKPTMRPCVSPPAMRNSLRSVGSTPALLESAIKFSVSTSPVPLTGILGSIVHERPSPGPTLISIRSPASALILSSFSTACSAPASTSIVAVGAFVAPCVKPRTTPSAEVSAPLSLATLSSSNTNR